LPLMFMSFDKLVRVVPLCAPFSHS